MRRKYDSVTRKRVWAEIKRLLDLHLPGVTIAEQMAKAGYKMPDGKTEITSTYVGTAMRRMDGDRGLKVSPAPAPTKGIKSDRLPSAVVGILTDPTLNAEQKVRMVIAYAEL